MTQDSPRSPRLPSLLCTSRNPADALNGDRSPPPSEADPIQTSFSNQCLASPESSIATAGRGLAGSEERPTSPARLVVFLSGRGSNLAALLAAQENGPLRGLGEIVGVVSDHPSAGGLRVAMNAGLPTLVVMPQGRTREEHDQAILRQVARWRPDLLLLAGYRRLVSSVLVNAFPGRILNIHPADPAQFRGLHAYRWAWEQALPETTVTIHLVDEGMDTGPILAQAPVDLRGANGPDEVEQRGLRVEHALYPRTVAEYIMQRYRQTGGLPCAASSA
ncbi:MAG: Phosphoribosylglycinamide formyltransferase [Candidatus Ozemobacter sibiricus]|jgi:phosphoribosylglycinamide formyltransferase-1|uniref:Phosphoribosylglycinamide formyltransferase n=1 Tax=Candidatus Ozemobacter sibiricus TaxID=2268124 RepID=A0A367ZIR9_9BACT|nr:MAG: Phosphoribosylglycinamide formyltransferase [Candidatus Ozemobacter sibiricus]